MRGIEITLREDGLFEAKSERAEGKDIRITHDARNPDEPWVALAQDETGVLWKPLQSFHSLDDALIFAAYSVAEDSYRHAFTVKLPDGTSFLRPGRRSAEEVMSSGGWSYVTTLIGFFMVTVDEDEGQFEARNVAMSRVDGFDVRLGEVHFVEQDEDGSHWCADISIDHDGFIEVEKIEAVARGAFRDAGVEVMPLFDFRTRAPVAGRTADVIEFPGSRSKRSAA